MTVLRTAFFTGFFEDIYLFEDMVVHIVLKTWLHAFSSYE